MSKIENRDNYILLPNSEDHNCFGCSPKNPSGMYMKFYTNEKRDSVLSWYSVPAHFCGWGDVVHGGIVSTILDEAMGWASLVILRKLFLSKTMAVDFLKPVLIGKELRAVGNVLKINSEREAVVQGCIYNDSSEICARSSSVISLFTLEAVREMGIMDEKMLRSIEQLMNISH